MSRRTSIIVLGLLAAALVGVALMAIPASPLHKKPTLGSTCRAASRSRCRRFPRRTGASRRTTSSRSVDIMRNRVDKLGVSEPDITKQGSDQIVIELPGVKDAEAAAQDHRDDGAARALRPRDVAHGPVDLDPGPAGRDGVAVRAPRAGAVPGEERQRPTRSTSSTRRRSASWPGRSARRRRRSPRSAASCRANRQLFAVPHGMVVVTCGASAVVCPGAGGNGVRPDADVVLPLQVPPARHPADDGRGPEALGHARRLRHEPGNTGQPIVTMEFTGKGTKNFERITP